MWKVKSNVNLFSQQQKQPTFHFTTTATKTTTIDNSGQSDPYVSFLLKQATQKSIDDKS